MEEQGSVEAFDGHEVKYTYRRAEDEKATVVMCHGITMERDEWNGIFSKIAKKLDDRGYSSKRFDFRGHGESELDDFELTVAGATMDLEAVISELEEVHILASSFGAVPSILTSSEKKVESLTLVCPLIDTRRNYFQPEGESFVDENREELEEKGFITRPDGFRMSVQILYELRSLRLENILQNLEVPVLTVQAGKDSAVPPEVSETYGAPNRKSEFHMFEGAEHGLVAPGDEDFGEGTRKNWEEFEELLLNFLTNVG